MAILKPYYPYSPISSIDILAKTLGVNPVVLLEISNKTNDSYTSFCIVSPNGKQRIVHEPKFELKKIQKRINSRILEHVIYPNYLQGGIKDINNPRDYVENARNHLGANQIICVDIKNFYPNVKYPYIYNIFKFFLKFPHDVSEILSNLVTYHNALPQGGCCSSYLANLVFFNSEY